MVARLADGLARIKTKEGGAQQYASTWDEHERGGSRCWGDAIYVWRWERRTNNVYGVTPSSISRLTDRKSTKEIVFPISPDGRQIDWKSVCFYRSNHLLLLRGKEKNALRIAAYPLPWMQLATVMRRRVFNSEEFGEIIL